MLRSENGIKEMFKHRKTAYQPYTEIINSKWDKHLKKNLHAAAYFLNPDCFFSENYRESPDVMRALLNLVTLHCKVNNLDSVEAMKEIHLYRDRKERFDRPEAVPAAKKFQPDEWWRLFGSSAPCLQKMAVRILSQASASSGCERNWSLFDQIHTTRRNRLEHDRLSDIMYVTYNLRLKSRKQKLQYDPIDIETIDKVDFWVTEEVVEKEPNLPSNIEDLLDEIDANLDQGGGGGSTSTFYAAPLAFSGPSSENEDIKAFREEKQLGFSSKFNPYHSHPLPLLQVSYAFAAAAAAPCFRHRALLLPPRAASFHSHIRSIQRRKAYSRHCNTPQPATTAALPTADTQPTAAAQDAAVAQDATAAQDAAPAAQDG
ncbi:uncharacterized protein [Arachis hypogaea]|uniref:uncharacterized protein n=1 Tax=Arachis hypogaea TaxID=3818 RepID=UPI003B214F49